MAASSKTASAPSETKLVQELADILDKSGLVELEYETDAVAIRLSRVTGAAPVVAAAPAVSAPAAAPAPAPAEPAAAANPAEIVAHQIDDHHVLGAVFGAAHQLGCSIGIAAWIVVAGPGAFDRPGFHQAIGAHLQEPFW